MSGCHSTEVNMCTCLCHIQLYPADYDFSGFICCDCYKKKLFSVKDPNGNIIRMEPIWSKHPMQELIDTFDGRIKQLEDTRNHRNQALNGMQQVFNEHYDSLENHIKNVDKHSSQNEGHLIALEARIEKLESQLNALTEMYKHLSISIAGLQDHHVRQIDENRKVSNHLDSLDESLENYREYRTGIEDLGTNVMYLNERIEKLESNNIDKQREMFHDKFLEKMSEFISDKPHKCPNCGGMGEFKNDEIFPGVRFKTTQRLDATGCYDMCKSCEGKGIVWG
jgi:uncharacterized coiled-coil protein SlyX